MRELDPGHTYRPHCYPAKEAVPVRQFHNQVQFRKRIGEGYPGNAGVPCDGTTTQELLRIIIARSIYVNAQEPDEANQFVIGAARRSIYELEERAARRRGPTYFTEWAKAYDNSVRIETVEPCCTCGHIFCQRHGRQIADAIESTEA